MAIAEIDSQPTTAASTRILSCNQATATTFEVFIQDGNYNPVDNDFMFIVTGR
jgi:hypothetical protein